jgi:hypothetical protein
MSQQHGRSEAERIRTIKNSNDIIGESNPRASGFQRDIVFLSVNIKLITVIFRCSHFSLRNSVSDKKIKKISSENLKRRDRLADIGR